MNSYKARSIAIFVLALLLATLVAMLLQSCRPATVITNTVNDSIVTVERLRIDTLRIPGETVITSVQVECDSVTNLPKPLKIAKKGRKSSAGATISSTGLLTVQSLCDSVYRLVEIRDKEIRRLSNRQTTVVRPVEYKTRTVDYLCRTFTAACLLALLALAALKWKRLI